MSKTQNGIEIVYGAAGLSHVMAGVPSDDSFHAYAKEILTILKEEGISKMDSAEIYPGTEDEIGYHQAGRDFTIDTKTPGAFSPEPRTKEQVVAGGKASLEKMKVKQIDVFYIHAPDTRVPWEEQLAAMNELYQQGAFRRLGLSNFGAEQVQEVYNICKSRGYPLPTVYQGNYSAVARTDEELLFPTLRRLGLSIYVWSPIAGGFLAKTRRQVEDGEGRFNTATRMGTMYSGMYKRPALLEGLDVWNSIASDAGLTGVELAYRWMAYHSALRGDYGDAIVFGASKIAHLKQTIGYLRAGPLPANAASRIEELWELVKHEAPRDMHKQYSK